MSTIDRLLSIVTPYECLGCTAEGKLLCSGCIQQLSAVHERCYRCLVASPASRTCSDCTVVSPLDRVMATTAYSGLAKDLLWQLKSAGAQAAARLMATHMLANFEYDPQSIIVPVPTATSRVRVRGYDQAKLLARELSRQTRLPCRNILMRSGQTHQVGASRAQRLDQLTDAFHVRHAKGTLSVPVLLIDDVSTTGATLESAARALRYCGATRIEALVFAQA